MKGFLFYFFALSIKTIQGEKAVCSRLRLSILYAFKDNFAAEVEFLLGPLLVRPVSCTQQCNLSTSLVRSS